MKHIILAGDSVFDNGSYVKPGEPDVPKQLKGLLDEGDKVSLLAVDGHVINNVEGQLRNLPNDTTHLVISVGGNNAMRKLNELSRATRNIGDGFLTFHDFRESFKSDYIEMLTSALSFNIPTTLCTIYNPCFSHSETERMSDYMSHDVNNETLQKMAMTTLPIFNDIIFLEAVNFNIPVIDLRLIFSDESDYANPIEPSAIGGQKMAKVIREMVYNHDFSIKNTIVYKGTTSGEGDISIGEGGISIPLSYLKEMSSFPKSDNKTTYKNRDEVKNKIKEIADYIYGDWEIDIEKDLDKVMPMGEIHGLDAMISLTKWGGFIEAIENEFGLDIDEILNEEEKEILFENIVNSVCNSLNIHKVDS